MFYLLFCAVMSEVVQPGILTGALVSLSSRSNRTYHVAPHNVSGQFFISSFRIGTLAMALCMCFYTNGDFSFVSYLLVCALVLGCIVTKMVMNVTVDYAFSITRKYGSGYEHYANIFTLMMLAIYPAELLLSRWYDVSINRWVFGLLFVTFNMIWLVRCLRMCIGSLPAIFYTIIFYLTAEVLPMVFLVYVTAKTIFNL